MNKTINLSTVKVYRISDLVSMSPRKTLESNKREKEDKRSRRTRNAGLKTTLAEPSSFKQSNKIAVHGSKPKKTKSAQNKSTDVLWLHDTKLKYFADLQDRVLPEKRKELDEILSLNRSFDRRKVEALNDEIRRIESRSDEMDYILKTQNVVAKYMEMLEKEDDGHLQRDTSGRINQFISKFDNIEKQSLTEEYCKLVNNGLMINSSKLKFDDDICRHCGGETITHEGFVSCTECGIVSDKSVHDFRVSYNDFQDTVMKVPFAYKRVNRFREILNTLQAKENTDIPEDVMNAIQKEIEKEQDIDISDINKKKIKYYLKRLSLTQYYEHAPHILNKINGLPAVHIPTEVEEKFEEMFKDIQEPFEIVRVKVCPDRLSFLSYNYVFYKFCEVLDLHETKMHFTLLKSPEKLRAQDKIWKGICAILGWEYIPSI